MVPRPVRTQMLVPAAMAVLLGCGIGAPVRAQDPASHLVPVEIVRATRRSVAPDVPLTGTIRARIQTDIGFRTAGRMVTRSFEVGQHVIADQVLAKLEPLEQQADVNNAEAALRSAQAQLVQAQLTFNRQQQLIASGYTTRVSFDAARAALDRAQAGIGTASAAVNTAHEQLSYTELRAGQAGTILSRNVEVGQVVQPGQTALVLAVDGSRDAVFEIPEAMVATPPTDRSVAIALQSDDRVRTVGTVREISPILDAATDTVTVKVAMGDAPAAMTLGSAVVGRAHLEARNAVLLPWSALFEAEGKPAVWVVDDKDQVSLRTVLIAEYIRDAVVLSGGLQGDERVVTAGIQLLYPGQTVTVVTP